MQGPTSQQIEKWWASMPKPLLEYDLVVEALIPMLYNLPPKIVAIDGLNGTGKTTLARYLSHRFNCSLIETDLFKIKAAVNYRFKEMKSLIKFRLKRDMPVFVEGVAVLRTLKNMNFVPNFHIYWENVEPTDLGISRDDELNQELQKYINEFDPIQNANLHVRAIIKPES
jgi:Cdc6-like AAA superfamily ATPase